MVLAFDIVIYIILFIAAAIGALIGMGRRLRRASVSACSTVISFFLALGGTALTAGRLTSTVLASLADSFGSSDAVREILSDAGAINAVTGILVGGLAGPILFMVYFLVLKLLLLIPCIIIKAIVKHNEEVEYRTNPANKGWGALIGAASAFFIVFSMLVPVIAYVGFAFDLAKAINPEIMEIISGAVDGGDSFEMISGSGVESADSSVYNIGVKPMVRYWSSVNFRGEKENIYTFSSSFIPTTEILADISLNSSDEESANTDTEKGIEAAFDFLDSLIQNRFLSGAAGETMAVLNQARLDGYETEVFGFDETLEEYPWFADLLNLFDGIIEKGNELYDKGEDAVDKEFEKYAAVLDSLEAFALSIYDGEENEGVDIEQADIDSFCEALETLNRTYVFEGAGSKLIRIIFSLDEVRETLPDADALADSLCEALEKNDGSLAKIFESAIKTSMILDELNSENSDTSLIAEKIVWLTENMNDSTAEAIKKTVTSSSISGYVPETAAGAVSEAVGNLCDKLASETNMSDESAVKESNALIMFYNIGQNITGDEVNNGIFDNKLPAADELVNTISKSSLVRDVVKELVINPDGSVNEKPFGTKVNLSDGDKEKLRTALEKYRADAAHDEDLAKALEKIFGV